MGDPIPPQGPEPSLRGPQRLLQKLLDLQCVCFGVAVVEKNGQLRARGKVLKHIQGPVDMRQWEKRVVRRARDQGAAPVEAGAHLRVSTVVRVKGTPLRSRSMKSRWQEGQGPTLSPSSLAWGAGSRGAGQRANLRIAPERALPPTVKSLKWLGLRLGRAQPG